MIGRIAGRIEYKTDDHVLIDVRGVGYVVHCSDRVLSTLPPPGEATAQRLTLPEADPRARTP